MRPDSRVPRSSSPKRDTEDFRKLIEELGEELRTVKIENAEFSVDNSRLKTELETRDELIWSLEKQLHKDKEDLGELRGVQRFFFGNRIGFFFCFSNWICKEN